MKVLIDYYLSEFHKNGESAVKTLCNIRVAKIVFLDAYKRLPPIPEEEVVELLQYANEMYPEKTEEDKIDITKIVYTIGNLL